MLLPLLVACGLSGVPASPSTEGMRTPVVESGYETPQVTASSQVSTRIVQKEPLVYQVIFQRGAFAIRQAFVGAWNARVIYERTTRISGGEVTLPDFKTDSGRPCFELIEATGWCTLTATVKSNQFQMTHNSLAIGGTYKLSKNGSLLWEGELLGGTCTPIQSIRIIGDEIAIGYITLKSKSHVVESILLTQGNTAIDLLGTTSYKAISLPSELQGQLVYFARSGSSDTFLVVEGEKVGDEYKSILNPCCCWDGPPMRVLNNREVVDFYAEKEDGWYHVQAGNLESLK
jgi:hypothetical protein